MTKLMKCYPLWLALLALALATVCLIGCWPHRFIRSPSPRADCDWLCQEAASSEQEGFESSRWDSIDDSCLCRFRDGQMYTIPRR